MRIATKLTLILLLAVSAVLAGFGYLRMQQERSRLTEEVQQEVLALTNAIRLIVEHALRDRRPEDIRELLAEIVRDPNPVDRVRIFNTRLEETASANIDVATTTVVPADVWDRVLKDGRPHVRYVDSPGRPVVYAVLPLKNPRGTIVGGLEVVHVAMRVQRQIRDATHDLALRMILLSLTIAVAIWLAVRVTIRRPLRALVRAVLAVGRGRVEERIALERRDEIGQLASAFNRMAEDIQTARQRTQAEAEGRLDAERQLQQAQKLAALGRLASEVAHEIGTPLSIISGRTEVIHKRLPPDHPLRPHAITVLRQVERISGIIRQLLDYARPRRPVIESLRVEPVFGRVVELLEPLADRRQIRLVARVPQALPPILADADLLQQVRLNLVTNALDAAAPGGQVRLTADDHGAAPVSARAEAQPRISRGRTPEPHVTLQVADTGCGIPPDRLEKIFEPFFSTKERRGGTGLGMSIVEDIARAHGAAIEIESAEGRGTTVRLRWPAAGEAVVTTGDADAATLAAAPRPTGDP
jgi:signal transduction histidine kinase